MTNEIPDYLAIARQGLKKKTTAPASTPASSEPLPISETEMEQVTLDAAIGILNRAGASVFTVEGRITIGLWPVADTPEIRYAIRILWPAAQVVSLADSRVPARYRDRPPQEPRGVSWSEWRADMVNRMFAELEATGQPGRITAETVRHGEAARREQGEAFLVNPFDEERTANVLARALRLPADARRERMEVLRGRVERNNVYTWGERFVSYLAEAAASRARRPTGQPPLLDTGAVVAAYRQAKKRLLFLNYDGTLAAYTGRPEQTYPATSLIRLLTKLAGNPANLIALVSGRRREDVERWFGRISGLWLAAEHGSSIRSPESPQWEILHHALTGDWKPRVLQLLESVVERSPGSLIEEKENSVVWHYRMSHPEFSEWVADELIGVLEGMLGESEVSAVKGQKCVEIRPLWINKGQVVEYILKAHPNADFEFAAGDDRTDEDMFAKLDASAWTVRVGKGDTGAKAYLPSPAALRALLELFVAADAEKAGHARLVQQVQHT